MVHCGSIRQTASITEMSAECLRTGDKARVKFRFVKHPEYLQVRFPLNMLKFLLAVTVNNILSTLLLYQHSYLC